MSAHDKEHEELTSSEMLERLADAGKRMTREDHVAQAKSYAATLLGAHENEEARKAVDKYFKNKYNMIL